MVPVLASLIALALGPALLAASRGQRWVLGGVDGFVVVSIGGIVLLHMLPHAYLVGGPSVLLIAAAGLLGPTMLERVVGPRLPSATRWMLPVALLGLALHAMLDGVVLVESHDGHGHEEASNSGLMALGVMLHRIPEGLAIWWVFRRQHGLRAALFALAVIAAATTVGFALAEHLEHFLGPLHGVQALVAGSLLHVLVHRSHDLLGVTAAPAHHHPEAPDTHHHPEAPDIHAPPPARLSATEHLPATVGALLGVAMLWGVSLAHPASHRIANELAMGITFSQLALRLAPALLASLVAEVLLTVSGLRRLDSWLGRRTPPLQVVFAFACSLVLLGVAPSVVYLLGAVLMSESITWLQSHGDAPRTRPHTSLTERTWEGLRSALFATDHVLPWMLLGLGAGAFVESSVAPGALALSPYIAVPLAALLGWPLRLYPVGLVPLLAVLVHKGLPPGAAIAFLLISPLPKAPLHRFHWRSSWRLVLVMLLIPVGAGLVLSWLPGAIRPSTLHEDALAPATSVEIVILAVLTLLALLSLLRRGPRAWVEQIVGEDDHDHPH